MMITIRKVLKKFPGLRRLISIIRLYVGYLVSSKTPVTGDIERLTPEDQFEYFFGYYDKNPWNKDQSKILALRARCTWKNPAPKEPAEIVVIDSLNRSTTVLGSTSTWNSQQGCMLQWLGPTFNERIIYNDLIDGSYRSIIMNTTDGSKSVICAPVYAVSKDGSTAFTLDFSRLHRLRKGYGYCNLPDSSKDEKVPNDYCIWKIDLCKNSLSPLIHYRDLLNFEPNESMIDAEHKVNHIMINPSCSRIMFLHRWVKNGEKYTRLITCDVDGKDWYNLSDMKMVSHCWWLDDSKIFAFERKMEGDGFYLMNDMSDQYEKYWDISEDGHPSFSHDGNYIVFDTYPDSARRLKIKVAQSNDTVGESIKVLAIVKAGFRYKNDTRCDLHPRWSWDDSMIAFDSVHEGKRGLYCVHTHINEA